MMVWITQSKGWRLISPRAKAGRRRGSILYRVVRLQSVTLNKLFQSLRGMVFLLVQQEGITKSAQSEVQRIAFRNRYSQRVQWLLCCKHRAVVR